MFASVVQDMYKETTIAEVHLEEYLSIHLCLNRRQYVVAWLTSNSATADRYTNTFLLFCFLKKTISSPLALADKMRRNALLMQYKL